MKCFMTGRQCDKYGPHHKPKPGHVFVATPFGFPFDALYENDGRVFQAFEQAAWRPERSDFTQEIGSVVCQNVCREIMDRDTLWADLSWPNANVLYELGLAYALGRHIFIAYSAKAAGRDHLKPFLSAWKDDFHSGFVEYSSSADLESKVVHLARDRNLGIVAKGSSEADLGCRQVLVVEDGSSDAIGLLHSIVENLDDCFKKPELKSKKAQKSGQDIENWLVESLDVPDSEQWVNNAYNLTRSSSVCIIDTSKSGERFATSANPLVYFALGMAHGLEKDVIPISNSIVPSTRPFDVHGLRHIFFTDKEQLRAQLRHVLMPLIEAQEMRVKREPYTRIWESILSFRNPLTVVYYGREPEGEERGRRTNVDSWDSRAVAEAFYYLAQQYPSCTVKAAPPRTKAKPDHVETAKEAVQHDLSQPGDYLIIGSPDNNDHAEVALANIYGIPPFERRINFAEDDGEGLRDGMKRGFIFYKDNLPSDIPSAFYCPLKEAGKKDNCVAFSCKEAACVPADSDGSGITYGVMTIAQNPFHDASEEDQGWLIVLSGFTGIATCGLMQMLVENVSGRTSSEVADDREFVESLNSALKRVSSKFPPQSDKPFTVLVEFSYKIDGEPSAPGDDRVLSLATVESILPVK